MTQSQQTPPPTDGIQRGSGRANPIDLIPLLGFLGFLYIFATMGSPDRMIWEEPARANQGEPVKPQCVAANPSPGAYEWRDCTPEELAKNQPQIFNTLTNRWE